MTVKREGSDAVDVRIWAIVPAAGRSRRMGRPKQTLDYGGSTLVARVVSNLLSAGADGVVVVTRSSLVKEMRLPRDDRVTITFNDDANSDMIDSIRLGLTDLWTILRNRKQGAEPVTPPAANTDAPGLPGDVGCEAEGAAGAVPSSDGILVVPADQPTIPPATYRCCMEAFKNRPDRIVMATFAGKRGHPIIFPAGLRDEVETLRGGLNQLAKHAPKVMLVETQEPGVLMDLDTPEQYARVPKTRPSRKPKKR